MNNKEDKIKIIPLVKKKIVKNIYLNETQIDLVTKINTLNLKKLSYLHLFSC